MTDSPFAHSCIPDERIFLLLLLSQAILLLSLTCLSLASRSVLLPQSFCLSLCFPCALLLVLRFSGLLTCLPLSLSAIFLDTPSSCLLLSQLLTSKVESTLFPLRSLLVSLSIHCSLRGLLSAALLSPFDIAHWLPLFLFPCSQATSLIVACTQSG